MAIEKKDRDLLKRFINLMLDIDDVNEDNIKEKIAEAEKLSRDCDARKAELEAERKRKETPSPVPTPVHKIPKLFTTPVKAEGMRHGPTEETYCSEQLIAEFIMSRSQERDFLFHIDIGTNTYLTFHWEDGFELHLTYTDEDNRESGGCTMVHPDADDIASMVLDMIGEDYDDDDE